MGELIVDYPASRPEQLACHDLPIPPAWLCLVCPIDHCSVYGANKGLRCNASMQIELGTDRNGRINEIWGRFPNDRSLERFLRE